MDEFVKDTVAEYIDKHNNRPVSCIKFYEAYVKRCNDYNIIPMSIRWFGREVKSKMSRVRKTTKRGKRVWCYIAKLSNPETQKMNIDMDRFCEMAKELFYYGREDFGSFVDWYKDWVKAENLKDQWGTKNNS